MVVLWLMVTSWHGTASASVEHANRKAEIIGEARNPVSGELMYRELYYLNAQKLPAKVDYRLPDGRLLARKTLDFSSVGESLYRSRPSVEHSNKFTGRLFAVDSRSGELALTYRESAKEALQATTLSMLDNSAVDAGFDEFVRLRWEQLLAGQTVIMNFLLPSRQRFVSLALQYRHLPAAEDSLVWIQARPDNGLLRLFVDPIDLYYERDSQRLIRYSGVSNLVDASGASMTVDISYQYPK
ncbi:hypothetical protein GCM10027217_16870 [Pseudomaricurvus hydrocarbonicus]